jgi:NAD(P)H-dependent FMN reductase
MDQLQVQIILGSTRQGRFGDRVAAWFHGVATRRDDLTADLLDLRDWPLPFFDEPVPPITGRYGIQAQAWADKVAVADAYVIVTPEYNHGYPAVLKNALDHVYQEWADKPVTFVSYGGPAGGSRAVEQLRQVVVELQMAPIREAMTLPFARRLFDERGTLTDPSYDERANTLLDQLLGWARSLRALRASPTSPA